MKKTYKLEAPPSRPVPWKTIDEAAFAQAERGACICGGSGFFRVNVEVQHPLFGKAIPCPCRQDERKREVAERLMRESGLSAGLLAQWTFGAFHPDRCVVPDGSTIDWVRKMMEDAKRACEVFAAHPAGRLVLTGRTGCGKTHLGYAIAGVCSGEGMGVYMARITDMLSSLRQGFSEDDYQSRWDRLRNVALLIIDDLGAEQSTPWSEETIYSLVDYRCGQKLPMVVTTNLMLTSADPKDHKLDERLRSRLLGEHAGVKGYAVILPAGDWRQRRYG